VELVSLSPAAVAFLNITDNDFITSPRVMHVIGVTITPILVILLIIDFIIAVVGLAIACYGPTIMCEVKLAVARAIAKSVMIPKEVIVNSPSEQNLINILEIDR
jgi:hypothetical protein